MPRPNILLLHTHDTGRHLGAYGRGADTRCLDRLASEGILFENAYCAAPQCSPSRASLFTGTHPHTHGLTGLVNRGFRLNEEAYPWHLAGVLARAGYTTHLFGIQHEADSPARLGYANAPDRKSVRCADIGPQAEAFLRSRPAQPFFASVGFFETHRDFTRGGTPRGATIVPPHLPDNPDTQGDIADLNWDAEAMDAAFGRILDALDQAGSRKNTLVIYTTDHGIAFPGAKSTLFEPGVEIALIARGPGGFEGGRRIASLVSNVDVYPTLMELLGIEPHPRVEGRSLLPLVRGEAAEIHDAIFYEQTYHAGYDPMRGVREKRFKYIRHFEPRPMGFPPNVDNSPSKSWLAGHTDYFRRPRPAEAFFDLDRDPHERNNLALDPAHARDLRRLRERLERWMKSHGDPLLSGFHPPQSAATVSREAAWDPLDVLPASEWLASRVGQSGPSAGGAGP